MAKAAGTFDLHAQITDRIVAAIEAGAGEFVMPWHRKDMPGGFPVNASTGKAYRGINILSLWLAASEAGFATNKWATFKQWLDMGATVRKGEKGSLITYYKTIEREDEEDEDGEGRSKRGMFAKPSWVFNAAQVTGFADEAPREAAGQTVELIEAADAAIRATLADIRHGGSEAFYNRARDFIQVPEGSAFVGSKTSTAQEAYYSVILHELAHWSGAEARLNREKGKKFGDKPYAFEELIAELAAAFQCAELGITNEPRLDHAQYIAGWLKALKDDRRAIFLAASAASAATDYILNFSRTGNAGERWQAA